jgi:hypothetical protein
MRGILYSVLVLTLAATAGAELYEFDGRMVDIEYWAGSGSNEAVCVVSFDPGLDYAFGFRWDGHATGFDMLSDIAGAGSLEVVTNDFGWGVFVDGIAYDGHSAGGAYPTDWLGYFTSEDGINWNVSGAGASDRHVANLDWDGWARQTSDTWPSAVIPLAPPDYTVVFRGTQTERTVLVGDPASTQLPEETRNLIVVSRHDGALNVLVFDLVYFGNSPSEGKYVEILRVDNCELVRMDDGSIKGVIEHDDVSGSTLTGTLTLPPTGAKGDISELQGNLVGIIREENVLTAFGDLDWQLEREHGFGSLDEVLDELVARGYPDPRE